MIAGMRDNACRRKIAEAIRSIPGVHDVDVNLYRASATIVHNCFCDVTELQQTVEKIGYATEPVLEVTQK